jgi:hypothetical protein
VLEQPLPERAGAASARMTYVSPAEDAVRDPPDRQDAATAGNLA